MVIRTAVAIYARISRDPDGDMLGVTRQLEDCRVEVGRRGWTVAEEYVDDDTSAYSGKARPEYERMLRDIAQGTRDAVIVYHVDRLHRRPIELEQFADTCARAGVTEITTVHGQFDMAHGDGMLVVRLMAAVAANESDAKSRRIKRKFLEVAETGAPYMGGGHRPFGFGEDRTSHYEPEAAVFREAAARVLAGESLYSVAASIEARGVTGTKGSKMTPTALRTLLLRPRNYGMRVHQRKAIGRGTWEPLISPEDGERLRLLLTDPARRKNRAARRYLLSGMLRCGKCGATMASSPRGSVRRYACGLQTTKRDPCKGTYITALKLEAFVADAVLARLDSPQLMETLSGGPDDEGVAALSAQITADEARIADAARAYTEGQVSLPEWLIVRNSLQAKVDSNWKVLVRMTRHDALEDYVGQGADLRARWESLNLSKQVPIIKALVDHVTIGPATKRGFQGLDLDRVTLTWRL